MKIFRTLFLGLFNNKILSNDAKKKYLTLKKRDNHIEDIKKNYFKNLLLQKYKISPATYYRNCSIFKLIQLITIYGKIRKFL